MGSILVSRPAAAWTGFAVDRWRGDDVVLIASNLAREGATWTDWLTVAAAFILGVVLAFATYWLGGRWSDLVGARAARG